MFMSFSPLIYSGKFVIYSMKLCQRPLAIYRSSCVGAPGWVLLRLRSLRMRAVYVGLQHGSERKLLMLSFKARKSSIIFSKGMGSL